MQYFQLMKNGAVWDCFDHPDDVAKYVGKILREEPESSLRINPISRDNFRKWKED